MRKPAGKEDPATGLGDSASLSDDGWMNTTVSSEQDVSGNIRVIDLKVEGEEIAVQILMKRLTRLRHLKAKWPMDQSCRIG